MDHAERVPGTVMMLRMLGAWVVTAMIAAVVWSTSNGRQVLAQSAVDTTITIRASGSTLEFTPTRVSARAGTRLRIRFINDGTLPHNLVVPKSDDDIDTLALAAYQAGETGYVPVDLKAKLLGWTTLASPGESVETTFVVPAAGEYTYICLFPGHSNSMLGTLRSLKP
jgi:plastocyanin